VLVRVDFNVPLQENGEVADDFRIVVALPTLQHILSQGASLVLMSHLGDPEGKKVERLSMNKVAEKLKERLKIQVAGINDCIGPEAVKLTQGLLAGEVVLLENLRFHKEEQENDENFAKELAKLGDFYVNDAFSVLHRKHASLVSVPKLLPSFGGLLLQKEMEGLQRLLKNPARPMVAVVGGKKVESKLPMIDSIAELADEVLLGNILSNEMIRQNISLGHKEKVILPLDGVPGQGKEYDIGPETRKLYQEKVRAARTVFWVGPLGRYEDKEYAEGSKAVAEAIVEDTSYAVAGGGNLLDFLGRYNLRNKFDHFSTGGSSMLAFLAGQKLPGLEALGYYD